VTKPVKESRAERRIDLAYSMAYWPLAIGTTPIFFLAAYLNQVTGASLAILGLISTVARIYDTLYNPLVGVATDHTRTRFGRRKPWVLVGFVGMLVILLIGIYALPSGASARFSPLWFAVGLAAFFTMWTTALVPYSAHSGEITTDYDRRSRMNLQQSMVGIISSLITYGVPYLLVDHDMLGLRRAVAGALPDVLFLHDVGQWLSSSALTGVANYGRVMVVLAWLTIISSPILIWRYLRHVPELPIPEKSGHPSGDKNSLLLPLRNPPFLLFCVGLLVFIAGYVGRLSLYPFIVPYATGGGYSFLLLMQIQGVSGIVAIPAWSRIFMRLERGQIMMLASAIEAAGLVCLGLSTHGLPYLSIIGSILIGLPGGTVLMVPYLVASECADYSRLKHGGDTRGLHTSIIGFIHKIGNFLATMGLAIAGALGFNPSHGVSAHDVATIKMLGLYGPAVLIVIGGAIMMTFPITRARHAVIQSRIQRRMSRQAGLITLEEAAEPDLLATLAGMPADLEAQA
jgi:GPH family glycoside/pentoside/hexuronide:cation symporter